MSEPKRIHAIGGWKVDLQEIAAIEDFDTNKHIDESFVTLMLDGKPFALGLITFEEYNDLVRAWEAWLNYVQ